MGSHLCHVETGPSLQEWPIRMQKQDILDAYGWKGSKPTTAECKPVIRKLRRVEIADRPRNGCQFSLRRISLDANYRDDPPVNPK